MTRHRVAILVMVGMMVGTFFAIKPEFSGEPAHIVSRVVGLLIVIAAVSVLVYQVLTGKGVPTDPRLQLIDRIYVPATLLTGTAQLLRDDSTRLFFSFLSFLLYFLPLILRRFSTGHDG